MHQDLQTLRSQIIVPELDCMQAELDGTIKLSTPEYGSIEGLDLKLELSGGRGLAMFQPIGFSRPDSWCRGSSFYPLATTISRSSILITAVTLKARRCGVLRKYDAPW